MGETIQGLQKMLEQKTQELNALRAQNKETDNTTVQELEDDIQNYVNQLQAANERIVELEEAQNIAKDVSHLTNSLRNLQKELQEIKTGAHDIKTGVNTHVNQFNSQLNYLNDRFRVLESTNSILRTNLTAANSMTDDRLRDLGRLKERLREAELARDVAHQHLRQQVIQNQQTPAFKNNEVRDNLVDASTDAPVDTIVNMIDASTGTPVDMFKKKPTPSTNTPAELSNPDAAEEFTYDGHTIEVLTAWPLAAKQSLAVISKQLSDSQGLLKQYMTKATEIAAWQQSTEFANVRADANEKFAKELEEKYKTAPPPVDPATHESTGLIPFTVDTMDNDLFNGLQMQLNFLNDELIRVQSEANQVQDELRIENEGLTDLNIQKDDELRAKDAEIRDLQQRLKAFNRKNVEKQTDLANAVMYESVEKLKDRSKSARRADSYRLRREADIDYAATMHELEKERREQDHERQKEIITLKAQLQQQKEAYDRLHEANKILHASSMELTKMDMTHAHQVGKMGLGASIYKDRQEHGVSLDLAKQGVEGDRAMRAKVIKNNEAGKLIAKLAGSSDDAIRALGASMFANLLRDMTTMTDEELQAANAPGLIKMYDDGVINNIITALATRSFINMMSQRTAQAYHPPRRVFMGRAPAGVGRSTVRAPRKKQTG
ncbi:Hypothetical protein GL50581_2042 [Giardia duodenalis ATCC 50581]|uniref:Uncharacterized protein n=1 Tax=Giardia intestinalis (strain ATCC 50581 / GS clone H7) TaxID=598745 RepID=C6LTE5_GIAIB|nr:Hypothetical protein GL50581_2042 [Giardia intestinalis ATCC 50581]